MKFVITGDSLFASRNLKKRMDPKIAAILAEADAVFTNAEFVTPRRDTEPAAGRGYQTSVHPRILDEFADLNMKYISIANNHTGDYGIRGMVDTIEEAEVRGLYPLGIGRTLREAREPVFIDTADGRISIITVDVTRSEVFAATDPGNGVAARPGVNPLRWSRTYAVSPEDYELIKEISRRIGVDDSIRKCRDVETFAGRDDDGDLYDFGSIFEGLITFERVRDGSVGVHTQVNAEDQSEILRFIRDARYRSDFVFVNLHTHEGQNENWYADYPPTFIEEFCRLAVDAGADCVFGHGAHFPRGAELYQGKPIFYNLGSLFMEFGGGECIVSPEMIASYGYRPDEVPSELHRNRTKDEKGNWLGFYSDPKFSQNFLVVFDLSREKKRFSYEMVPLDLQMTNEIETKRGMPVLASKETSAELFGRLDAQSRARYGTAIVCEEGKYLLREV